MSATHVVLKGSERPAQRNAERLHNVNAEEPIEVTLSLRGPALPDANNLPKAAMSRDALAAQYGASQEDIKEVTRVLGGYGLKVEEVSPASRSMRVSGTVSQMEAAFEPQLGIYRSAGQRDYRGRKGDLKVPTELSGIVTGIFGFDERRVAQRKSATTMAPPEAAKAQPKPARLKPLGPADLEARYHFPAGTGQGQQIGIAEFDGGYFADDLQAYCAKFGRPTPNVTTVAVGKTPFTLDQIRQLPADQRNAELGASTEVMMDVQVIAGLCPEAQIFVYFAPFTQKGWVDLLNTVIAGTSGQPAVLSISWGLAEDDPDWSQGAVTAINDRLQALALLGITACISSGDDGSGDELTDGRAHVDFPGASPYVLCVGGTMLTGAAANLSEDAWWVSPGRRNGKGGGSSGGGVSVLFPRPQWQDVQIQSLNANSIDGRVIPDVSALAGPPLYDLILLGGDAPNGGTSASAPLWAALIARINAELPAGKRQRFLTPLLYQKLPNQSSVGAASLVDMTVGQNASHPQPGAGYQCQAGFDAVTGWGVPGGQTLLQTLATI